MQTTSWLDYIQADSKTRLQMDRASARHREELAALQAQTQALRDLAVIGVEQVKGLAQVATSVEGVRSDLAALTALFDWRLEQTHQQLQVQTETLNALVYSARNPVAVEAQEYWRRGQEGVQDGLWDEAVKDFERAVELDHYLYPALFQLGFIQAYQSFNFQAATRAFTEAARRARKRHPPTAALAHLHLHKFERESGKLAEAWDSISQACELDPKLAVAWWDKATLARELEKWEDIVPSIRAAVTADALYWHRSKDENWSTKQQRVDALLTELAESVERAAKRTQQEAESWFAQTSADISSLRLEEKTVMSHLFEPTSRKLEHVFEGLRSPQYSIQAAANTAASSLLTQTSQAIASRATALLESLNSTLRALQTEDQELTRARTDFAAKVKKEVSESGGWGCLLLGVGLTVLFFVLGFSAGGGWGWLIAWLVIAGISIAIHHSFVKNSDDSVTQQRLASPPVPYDSLLTANAAAVRQLKSTIATLRRLSDAG